MTIRFSNLQCLSSLSFKSDTKQVIHCNTYSNLIHIQNFKVYYDELNIASDQ